MAPVPALQGPAAGARRAAVRAVHRLPPTALASTWDGQRVVVGGGGGG